LNRVAESVDESGKHLQIVGKPRREIASKWWKHKDRGFLILEAEN